MIPSSASPPSRLRQARSRQAGEGRFQAVIWLIIIVWVFLAGFEFIPTRYRVSEFEDAVRAAGERAGQVGGSAAKIKGQLLWEANQLDLPVNKDNLNVVANTSFVRIDAAYTVPIKLPLYTYNWQVTHELRRKVFRF